MSEDDENEERINIMALGNAEVGKTSFILKYTENTFEEVYLGTIGIDYKIKFITIKDKQYKLFFYDTTGQEKYKSIALNIIKNVHGIILMYDITNGSSYDSLPNWIQSIKEERGNNFPMILLGNKTDLQNKRVINKEEGEYFAKNNNIEFFETSCKDGININEAGLCLIHKIIEIKEKEGYENNSSHSSKLSKSSSNSKKDDSKKCCY